jgi:hypothetical protein
MRDGRKPANLGGGHHILAIGPGASSRRTKPARPPGRTPRRTPAHPGAPRPEIGAVTHPPHRATALRVRAADRMSSPGGLPSAMMSGDTPGGSLLGALDAGLGG